MKYENTVEISVDTKKEFNEIIRLIRGLINDQNKTKIWDKNFIEYNLEKKCYR